MNGSTESSIMIFKNLKTAKKLFRTAFTGLTALTCVFAAACSSPFSCGGEQKTYYLFTNEKWLANGTYEVCTYGIEYKKPEADKDGKEADLPVRIEISPESSLVTKLSWDNYKGTPCFKFETTLTIIGSYQTGGESDKKVAEFSDETTSVCYFLKDKLSPVYSEKTVKNTTPYSTSTGYNFVKTHYEYSCAYDSSSAKATVTVNDLGKENENDLYYEVENGERTYENYNNNFIENELMLLFPRTCALEEGYYQSFKTLDVLSAKIHDMRIAVSTSAPSLKYIAPKGYNVDGVENTGKEINAHNVNITINSTFSGSELKFGVASAETENYRLLTFKTDYAYNLGSLNYSLKSVKTKAE